MSPRTAYRVLIASFTCLALASTAGAQTTWYVDAANCPGPGSGTPADPFCKIQDAINAAAYNATPPDEILVADGIYTGPGNRNLDFGGRILKLRSTSGNPAASIIDCEGSGRGFYFHRGETAEANVNGFTIRNGYVTQSSPGGSHGGGVFCFSSNPTLIRCAISGNTAAGATYSEGGGVACALSSPVLIDCTITGNAATGSYAGSGGGVSCEQSSNPTLTTCIIGENTASTFGAGGGLYCSIGCHPTLTGCTINGNCAATEPTSSYDSHGGGLCCAGGGLALTDCTINGNQATGGWAKGGGIFCGQSTTLAITNCTIDGNTAADGGGVYSQESSPNLTNCLITQNVASKSSNPRGGGVYSGGGSPTLTNCTIISNTAASGGGVYCASGPSLKLTNCILWGDTPQEIQVASGTPLITYCDVQGGYPGTGNIDADPGFAFVDDSHLTPGSPCADTGTNAPIGGLPPIDLDGNARPLDADGDGQAVADMGVYEFNPATPALAVSPSRIVVCIPEGQVDPAVRTLSIRNGGGGVLHWTLSGEASWLQAEPRQGDSTGEVDTATLTVDAGPLLHGTYSTMLTAADPEAFSTPRSVELVLHVTNTLHVPENHATIQAAIDAAAVPGDQIVLADGTYTGEGNKNLDFHGRAIAVRSAGANPAVCIIDCEGSGRGFYFHSRETASAIVDGITIRNGNVTSGSPGWAYGGGVYCSDSSPTLTNCVIGGNAAFLYGGGVYCSVSSAKLTNCVISGNMAFGADYTNGGGVYCQSSNSTLTNCTISGNSAFRGGGMYGGTRATNCIITDNTAFDQGGGVYGDPTLTNCTIGGNTAVGSPSAGGGVCSNGSSSTLTNCILWGDTPQEISVLSGTLVVTYSDVQGGYAGTGNIDLDPEFAFTDDFHLAAGSPCVDAGTNTPPAGLPSHDLDGNARPLDGDGNGGAVADMGAYEFRPDAPAIALSPARIAFYIPEDQAGQVSQILSIRNAGGGTLHWTLTGSAPWVQADTLQGESTGEADVVTLTADATALAHGVYSTAVVVTDPQASNNQRIVEVILYATLTLHVPDEYATIQAAIDASVPGDDIVVADGTYTGLGNKDLDFHGKAIRLRSAGGNSRSCIIDCEGSGRGFYFHSGEPAAAVVDGFTIRHGYVSDGGLSYDGGGGVCCLHSNPTLTNCVISGNTAEGTSFRGGGVYSYGGRPTLTHCTIIENTASQGGGASFDISSPLLAACTISRNTASQGGGAYFNLSSSLLTNCTISANMASQGGAAYLSKADLMLTDCTIAGNSATSTGGGLYSYSSTPTLTNCILWGDEPQEIQVTTGSPGTPDVTYCDVQGGYEGTGNLDADPAFAFADDPHLMPGSPCLDAGTNTPAGGLPDRDADGNPRPLDADGDGQALADMGAYEFCPGAPAIALSPARIVLPIPQGQPGQEPKTLSIRNAGGGILHWTLAWEGSWLQTDPLQGESAGEVNEVTFTADATALTHGTYSTMVTVADPQASNQPRVVEVILYVTDTLHVPSEHATIQAAIDAAVPGDEVVIADGTYAGPGNKDLDFHGKALVVRSTGRDPALCTIDCEGNGRGFYFHSRETATAVVEGITIRNGYAAGDSPSPSCGGGVSCLDSNPTLTHCVITANTATGSYSYGGGVFCSNSSSTLTNCVINANTAAGSNTYGGAIACFDSDLTLTNCTIQDNICNSCGGGVYCSGSTPTLINCTIHGNDGGLNGGGVYCTNSNPSLTDCRINGNTSLCIGGGIACNSSSPTLAKCTINGNAVIAPTWYYSPGGGGMSCENSSPTLSECAISGNTVSGYYAWGSGLYCNSSSSPILTNCTISGNNASGWYNTASCVYCDGSSPTLTNSILWNDTPREIYVLSSTPAVSFCDIQGGYTGTGNTNLDPLFVDPDGPDGDPATWQDNDYRLSAGSPCIDAGNNAAVPADTLDLDGDGDTTEPTPFDLDGHPRFVDDPATPDCPYVPGTCGTAPIADMGAFEYQGLLPLGDLNCDGLVNPDDIAPFVLALIDPAAYQAAYPGCELARADLNASGTADGGDIQAFVNTLLGL